MKKGFTLIELLAVIVILGVIALITVPVVMNLVEDARRGSFQASLNNLVHTMEINQTKEEDGELSYTFPNDAAKINMKGELSKWSGEAKINSKGKANLRIYNGKYCGYISDGEVQVKVMNETACLGQMVLDDSLIFMLDNNIRGTVTNQWLDASGNGYDGKISGATWTDDGLYFDGQDDYVDIVSYDTDTITLEVYFKAKTIFSGHENFLITNMEGCGHAIFVKASNSKIFSETYINNAWSIISDLNAIALDTFYHVVYTYDGSVQRLYVNGNEVVSQSITGTVINPGSKIRWVLGANQDNENGMTLYRYPFNGTIHTARLYNRALTKEEVKQNYLAVIQNS